MDQLFLLHALHVVLLLFHYLVVVVHHSLLLLEVFVIVVSLPDFHDVCRLFLGLLDLLPRLHST